MTSDVSSARYAATISHLHPSCSVQGRCTLLAASAQPEECGSLIVSAFSLMLMLQVPHAAAYVMELKHDSFLSTASWEPCSRGWDEQGLLKTE